MNVTLEHKGMNLSLNVVTLSLYLSFSYWLANDRARRCDMARSTIILQDALSLAAAFHPCRYLWSPTVLASPDQAIEFAVVPCALCRTGDRCRTPSWWGMRLGHAIMPQPSYPVASIAQQARGSSFFSTLNARTQRQRWSGGCVAQTRPERLHPPLGWSRTRVHREPSGETMCDISHISCGLEVFWIAVVGEAHSSTIPLYNASSDYFNNVYLHFIVRSKISSFKNGPDYSDIILSPVLSHQKPKKKVKECRSFLVVPGFLVFLFHRFPPTPVRPAPVSFPDPHLFGTGWCIVL